MGRSKGDKMKKILMLVCLALAGCASNSGIVSIGKDSYMISRQAATGFSGSNSLKAKALREAGSFCTKQDKQLQVVSISESSPPYLLGNYPKAEVQFMCLNADDSALKRPEAQLIQVPKNELTSVTFNPVINNPPAVVNQPSRVLSGSQSHTQCQKQSNGSVSCDTSY